MVNEATHKHRLKEFSWFKYRVTNKGAFCLQGDEWVKTSVDVNQLIPLGEKAEVPEQKAGKRLLIGTHEKTGDLRAFKNVTAAMEEGFSSTAIYQCLNLEQSVHKGYAWEWSI